MAARTSAAVVVFAAVVVAAVVFVAVVFAGVVDAVVGSSVAVAALVRAAILCILRCCAGSMRTLVKPFDAEASSCREDTGP